MKLKELTTEEIEILTLYVIYGYTQEQIAQKIGISQKGICKKLIKIKNIINLVLK